MRLIRQQKNKPGEFVCFQLPGQQQISKSSQVVLQSQSVRSELEAYCSDYNFCFDHTFHHTAGGCLIILAGVRIYYQLKVNAVELFI